VRCGVLGRDTRAATECTQAREHAATTAPACPSSAGTRELTGRTCRQDFLPLALAAAGAAADGLAGGRAVAAAPQPRAAAHARGKPTRGPAHQALHRVGEGNRGG
jgi:hypothetical protein